METKKCLKCGEIKEVSYFYKHRGRKDGLCDWCKDCVCEDQRIKRLEKGMRPMNEDVGIGKKRCSRCREIKDVECFGVKSAATTGLSCECKECRREQERNQRRANGIMPRPVIEPVEAGEKRCLKCGEAKLVECFGKNKSANDGLQGWCKECQREYDRKRHRAKAEAMGIRPRSEDVGVGKKRCTKCEVIKNADCFYKSSDVKSGLSSWCKECVLEHDRIQRIAKGVMPLFKGKVEDGKKYCYGCDEIKDVECFTKDSTCKDGYYSRCKSCKREYVIANKDMKRAYAVANRDRINKQSALRRKNNASYRMRFSLSSRILHALNGKRKSASTMTLIGCTIEELWLHLESQFTEGMHRNNRGINGWHIDHIVPCAAFDLTDPEQQKICFHYTNLQPLWAEDNLRKSDKLPHEWEEQNGTNKDERQSA